MIEYKVHIYINGVYFTTVPRVKAQNKEHAINTIKDNIEFDAEIGVY